MTITRLSAASALFGLALSILCIAAPSPAAASETAEFVRLFEAGEYGNLRPKLEAYRKTLLAAGRINLRIDFMLSVCRCRQPGLRALERLPARFRHLTRTDRRVLAAAAQQCRSGRRVATDMPRGGRARVMGKGGRSAIRSALQGDREARFEKSTFRFGQQDAAVAYLRAQAVDGPESVEIVAGERFVVVGAMPRAELEAIERLMAKTLRGLVERFRLPGPRTLIVAYLFADRDAMRAHARRTHGLDLPEALWAYSFPPDASLNIWTSGGLGTVGHEVMHTLLDHRVPYAPPWLNEGAAALFEEFEFGKEGIRGVYRPDHWRVQHIRAGAHVPLGELLAMDWHTFDAPGQLDRNHATARFFALYLQEMHRLGPVIEAWSGVDLFDDVTDAALLERTLGDGIDTIARDFDRWMNRRLGGMPPAIRAPASRPERGRRGLQQPIEQGPSGPAKGH